MATTKRATLLTENGGEVQDIVVLLGWSGSLAIINTNQEARSSANVRREDLYDSSADEGDVRDEEVDAALRDKLNAQLSGLLSFSRADTSVDAQQQQHQHQQQLDAAPGPAPDHDGDDDDAEDLAFSFRLFRDEAPSHKVVLEKDEALEKAGGGGFVVARRPTSYYLAEKPSQDAMASFRAAAVTPDHLLQDAGKRRWGLEKPWRVTNITISTRGVGMGLLNSHAEGPAVAGKESADGKKRPGKRRRIILRTRQKARKEREEAEKLKLVEKEQHIIDKKKRLNREKKLKRRAKEREKKHTMKGEGQASEPGSSRATSPE
ncbi:hypothetical protein SLS62_003217 [Diatrype stigma]|uniref:Uncharacterized protein n=1 Tax=Diatrype stigma TaxID=117547 RepID=A0AAN9UVE1_9PEZI